MLEKIPMTFYQDVSACITSYEVIWSLYHLVFLMLLPLFALSGALSWYLAKEIDRENKKKEKQGNKYN